MACRVLWSTISFESIKQWLRMFGWNNFQGKENSESTTFVWAWSSMLSQVWTSHDLQEVFFDNVSCTARLNIVQTERLIELSGSKNIIFSSMDVNSSYRSKCFYPIGLPLSSEKKKSISYIFYLEIVIKKIITLILLI